MGDGSGDSLGWSPVGGGPSWCVFGSEFRVLPASGDSCVLGTCLVSDTAGDGRRDSTGAACTAGLGAAAGVGVAAGRWLTVWKVLTARSVQMDGLALPVAAVAPTAPASVTNVAASASASSAGRRWDRDGVTR